MISAKQLAEKEHKRLEVRKETYRAILEQLCRKIRSSADLGERSIFLTIPPFVVGYPVYDTEHATIYLQRQFTRLGYQVIRVDKMTLGISWGQKEPKGPQIIDHSEEEDMRLPSLSNLQKTAANLKKSRYASHTSGKHVSKK